MRRQAAGKIRKERCGFVVVLGNREYLVLDSWMKMPPIVDLKQVCLFSFLIDED